MMSPALPVRPRSSSIAVRAVLSRAYDLLVHRDVSGLENVPKQGPCLVVFNQLSLFDTPLVSISIPRPDVTGLVSRDYRRNVVYRVLIEQGGGMWIRRGASDRRALEDALAALAGGWAVGISPEGRRSRTGGLIEAKPGAAFLAIQSGAPILPLAFTHTDRMAASLRRFRRITIGVRFGIPFTLPALEGRGRKQRLRHATDVIMCRLAAQLPVEYRGVYASHPGLRAGGLEPGGARQWTAGLSTSSGIREGGAA
jgi:1-acyl-sn-glycerol-3-phosphate acyltransferase